jgi:hypothetical protein
MNESSETGEMARVCNDLFVRLLEPTGGRIELGELTDSESIVVLVWHVNGLIGNMGLAHTLEVDIAGDLAYSNTLRALTAIKADASFQSVREAIGICRTSTGAKTDWESHPNKRQRLEELDESYFESEVVLIEQLYRFICEEGLAKS